MHGDAVEDDVDVNEFSEEATGVMPPLPRASWFLEDIDSKAYRDVLQEVSETLQWGSPTRRVSILRLFGLEARTV